jgi:hypothetical protein
MDIITGQWKVRCNNWMPSFLLIFFAIFCCKYLSCFSRHYLTNYYLRLCECGQNNVTNAHRSLFSLVKVNQPKKSYNNQHWVDKILEEGSTRKTRD